MWNEAPQARLRQLQEAEAQGELPEAERAELDAFIAERIRHEEASIEAAIRRNEEEAARLEEQLRRVQEQNRQLEALVQEQSAYLAELKTRIARHER